MPWCPPLEIARAREIRGSACAEALGQIQPATIFINYILLKMAVPNSSALSVAALAPQEHS